MVRAAVGWSSLFKSRRGYGRMTPRGHNRFLEFGPIPGSTTEQGRGRLSSWRKYRLGALVREYSPFCGVFVAGRDPAQPNVWERWLMGVFCGRLLTRTDNPPLPFGACPDLLF